MSSLEKPILTWFKKNKRDLPWRNTSPWGVMVSEYMLQQTPVNRVLPKWNEWMERWPTPKDLATATPAQVITAWDVWDIHVAHFGYMQRRKPSLRISTTKFPKIKRLCNCFRGLVNTQQRQLLHLHLNNVLL